MLDGFLQTLRINVTFRWVNAHQSAMCPCANGQQGGLAKIDKFAWKILDTDDLQPRIPVENMPKLKYRPKP